LKNAPTLPLPVNLRLSFEWSGFDYAHPTLTGIRSLCGNSLCEPVE
jgi:hypothetical protein